MVSLRAGIGIDAHAHVFNAADLPNDTFVLGAKAPFREFITSSPVLSRAASYVIDALLGLLENAPDAAAEHAYLDGDRVADPLQEWERGVGGFLRELLSVEFPSGNPRWPNGLPALLEHERRLLGAALREELEGRRIEPGAGQDASCAIAEAVGETTRQLRLGLQWVRQLSDFRIRNVDRLFELYGQERLGIGVCLPALVDFHRWLPDIEDAYGSPRVPLVEQVSLMERIVELRPGVHPMLAVDPLAEWDATFELLESCFNLDGAGEMGNGFAGIKLYPPMGFAPDHNTHLRDVSASLAATVERNLERLYEYCEKFDVPIMAHCAGSNLTPTAARARTHQATRWKAVLEGYGTLRVNLAHFGGVEEFAKGFAKGEPNAEQEVIGELMRQHQVWTDIAHASGVVERQDREELSSALNDFFDRYSVADARVMYGSDWIMLELDPAYPNYLGNWEKLAVLLEGGDEGKRRFFGDNALGFLGVTHDGKSRRRFDDFYQRIGATPRWLPELEERGS